MRGCDIVSVMHGNDMRMGMCDMYAGKGEGDAFYAIDVLHLRCQGLTDSHDVRSGLTGHIFEIGMVLFRDDQSMPEPDECLERRDNHRLRGRCAQATGLGRCGRKDNVLTSESVSLGVMFTRSICVMSVFLTGA